MDGNYNDQYGFSLPDDELLSEDVDSMDVHSRTEESLTSELQFQDQLQNAILTPTPSSRKRTKKVVSASLRNDPNIGPRSRARAKKPHEPLPFLSIDNMPTERLRQEQASAKQVLSRGGSSKNGARPPINTPNPHIRGQTQSQLRSLSTSSWNTLVPKKHGRLNSAVRKGNPPNLNVHAPFKHNVNNSAVTQEKVAPDQQLKEQTANATILVAKTMAKQKPSEERLIQGRLLKAKLKPLNVVRVEGPSMDKCRGIVAGAQAQIGRPDRVVSRPASIQSQRVIVTQPRALHWDPWGLTNQETRSYEASPSKTLQRRRHILNTIASDYMYERPQTMESLHRTSIASDLTEAGERDVKDALEGAEANILNADMEDASSIVGGVREPPNTIATYSNPNSRFTAASMVNVGAPPSDCQMTSPADANLEVDEESVVTAELNQKPLTPEEATPVAAAPTSPQVVDQTSTGPALSAENQKSETNPSSPEAAITVGNNIKFDDRLQDPQFIDQANRKRSANSSIPAEEFEMSLNQVERQNRPTSVQDPNQRKEVRFADVQDLNSDPDRKPSSGLARVNKDDESKENRGRNGKSCKDESLKVESKRRDEDDDDDLAGGDNPQRRSGMGSGRQRGESSQGNRPSSRQAQSQSRTSGNKGSGGKQQAMTIVTSNLDQGNEDPILPERNRSPVRQPRSQLGMWEDVMKPDDNPCALSIEGIRQSSVDGTCDDYQQSNPLCTRYDDNGENNHSINGATIAFNRKSRPKSAKGPKELQAEEQEKETRKLIRPQSASSYRTISTSESVMMGQARMNIRDSPPKMKQTPQKGSVTNTPTTTQKKRQVVFTVATRKRPASAHVARTTSASARRPRSAVPSNKEARSKNKCTYCGTSASKTINYHHGIFFSVCDTCSKQSSGLQQTSDMCNTRDSSVEERTETTEKDLIQFEDEVVVPVEREADFVGMDHIGGFAGDCQGDLTEEQSNDTGCPQSEGQLLTNLDDLEKSLALVQQEIRSSLQQVSVNKAINFTTQTSASAKSNDVGWVSGEENVESISTGPVQAEFSQVLTDVKMPESGFAYRMSVFQFSDETSQSKDEKPSGRGDISSYEVTMMNEADGATVKADKEAEGMALLNMLCQQMKNSEMIGGGEKSTQQPLDSTPLQVIATPKTMSQPKSNSGEANPIAPIAPLCFRVNARPPRGLLYYFAYGMDMNPDRFSNYIRKKTEERFWGLLYGFRLAFNKKGVDSEAGGFPNLLFDQASAVEGCLYLVSPEDIDILDRSMGYPGHFEHVMLPVWLLNCNDPEGMGVAQYCVPALMYIAKDEWIHTGPDALDNSFALDQCLKGASLLSANYKENMAAMRH